jgi:hypothetical protein
MNIKDLDLTTLHYLAKHARRQLRPAQIEYAYRIARQNMAIKAEAERQWRELVASQSETDSFRSVADITQNWLDNLKGGN